MFAIILCKIYWFSVGRTFNEFDSNCKKRWKIAMAPESTIATSELFTI